MTSFQKANSGTLSALPRWPLPSPTTSEKGYLSFSELFLQQERERQRESLRRRIAENAKKWTEYHARLKEYNGRSRSREATKQEQEESSKSSPPRVFDDGGGPMDRRRASCCANLACAASTSQDLSVNAWPDNTALLARSSSISHAEDKLAMQHIGIIRGAAAAAASSEMYGAVQVDESSDNEEEEDEELDAVVDGQLYFRTRKSRASVRDFLPLHAAAAPAAASQSSPSTKEGNRLYAPSHPTKRPPGPQHHIAGGSGSGASSSSSLSSSFDMASSLSGSFSGNSSSSTGSSSSRPPSRRYSERTVESCESVSTEATSLSFAAEEAEEGDSKRAVAAA